MQVNTPAKTVPIGHPIKLMAAFVNHNEWRLQYASESEIAVEIAGRWAHYALSLRWQDSTATLHITAEPDIFIAREQFTETHCAIARINRAMTNALGHFDLMENGGRVCFRSAIPMRGTGGATPEQIEDIIATTISQCEHAYPALYRIATGVASAIDTAEDSVAVAMMETAGSA